MLPVFKLLKLALVISAVFGAAIFSTSPNGLKTSLLLLANAFVDITRVAIDGPNTTIYDLDHPGYLDYISTEDKLLLVLFYGPDNDSDALEADLQEIYNSMYNDITVVKINGKMHSDAVDYASISTLPTVLVYDENRRITQFSRFNNSKLLEEKIAEMAKHSRSGKKAGSGAKIMHLGPDWMPEGVTRE